MASSEDVSTRGFAQAVKSNVSPKARMMDWVRMMSSLCLIKSVSLNQIILLCMDDDAFQWLDLWMTPRSPVANRKDEGIVLPAGGECGKPARRFSTSPRAY